MNFEFHYYAVHWLARKAGLSQEEAYLVAYSSQYVDAAVVPVTVLAGEGRHEIPSTQNYGFWNPETVDDVYLPFHFLPGGPAPSNRADGRSNPWSTRPDSPLAKELLVAALGTRDPFRVGIALHAYADTWAHQNFSGRVEDWNRVEQSSLIPAVGHAQALKNPDGLENEWSDPRLAEPRVANRGRFLEAARKIYKYLATYSRRGFDDVDAVMEKLGKIWKRGKGRNERVFDLIIDEPMPEYVRLQWLNEAGVREEGQENEDLFSGYSKLLWLKSELLYRSEVAKRPPVRVADAELFGRSRIRLWSDAARAHLALAKAAILRESAAW